MKNWKTTLSGLASIISGISLFVNDNSKISEAIGLVIIGIGLISAKDNNVTGGTIDNNPKAFSDDIGGGGIKNPPTP